MGQLIDRDKVLELIPESWGAARAAIMDIPAALPAAHMGAEPCGGCGNDDPSRRCLGCLHDFGAPQPLTPPPVPTQCCMCGKTGLSTVEDGGPEAELDDGRWICSDACYSRAVDLAFTLGDALDALNPTSTERNKAAQIIQLMRTVRTPEMAEALALAGKLTLAEALELPEIKALVNALAQCQASLYTFMQAYPHMTKGYLIYAENGAITALAALQEKGGDA